MIQTLAQVAAGGAIGASARYLVVAWATRFFGAGFPLGTLVVNVIGSLAIGVFAVILLSPKGNAPISPLLITGVLGGFTTFSAFSLDVIRLIEAGRMGTAALYMVLSVILSLLACVLGMWMARGGVL